jgi:hypothetical protein
LKLSLQTLKIRTTREQQYSYHCRISGNLEMKGSFDTIIFIIPLMKVFFLIIGFL